ncbi:hypothetical protein Ahy_A08g039719 [Arachis hypogaea]|uniref:Aminotransferase-like plant mobile domain-containing protein n=1 Tax=Arachis hypogaea TaxID=3818 RepID=A0A445BXK7_ARAHY|nr:hypothetical protein Ahy_A08g039719 [Arachis hypogaea]
MLSVLPPANQIQKFVVNCTWFQESFGECPKGADEERVRRNAHTYIMMLLGTQLFADRSGNRIHIRWLPYVARLEEMGGYSWGSAALAWLYRLSIRRCWSLVIRRYGGYWHLHWETRADHVLRFDVVADPGPSHDFLDWWRQHGKRFLSPEIYLGDPRAIPIPVEATQRGAGRVPDMDRVDNVPDRHWVERRARVGTRRSQREWRWLDQAMEEGDEAGRGGDRRRGRGGRRRAPAVRNDHGDRGEDVAGGVAAVGC